MVRAGALVIVALAGIAHADRDLCAPGEAHHGAAIDLDLKAAPITDVLRLLADVGHVNLVVSDEVQGRVTLRLKQVAWDAATCAIAGMNHLTVTVRDNILLVRPSSAR